MFVFEIPLTDRLNIWVNDDVKLLLFASPKIIIHIIWKEIYIYLLHKYLRLLNTSAVHGNFKKKNTINIFYVG